MRHELRSFQKQKAEQLGSQRTAFVSHMHVDQRITNQQQDPHQRSSANEEALWQDVATQAATHLDEERASLGLSG